MNEKYIINMKNKHRNNVYYLTYQLGISHIALVAFPLVIECLDNVYVGHERLIIGKMEVDYSDIYF